MGLETNHADIIWVLVVSEAVVEALLVRGYGLVVVGAPVLTPHHLIDLGLLGLQDCLGFLILLGWLMGRPLARR